MELRATLTLRNETMIQWRKNRGFSQRRAAEYCGVSFTMWQKLERLEYPQGYPENIILSLAVTLQVLPDQIMPPEMRGRVIGKGITKSIEATTSDLIALEAWGTSNAGKYILPPAEAGLEAEELKAKLLQSLQCLTFREREIVKLRYGIGDGHAYSCAEVGRIFKVTREHVRQVEAKAIRKLQRPDRLEILLAEAGL